MKSNMLAPSKASPAISAQRRTAARGAVIARASEDPVVVIGLAADSGALVAEEISRANGQAVDESSGGAAELFQSWQLISPVCPSERNGRQTLLFELWLSADLVLSKVCNYSSILNVAEICA